ncbi:TetR/AcrR family transcriptional regulator [Janthinobacterium lividum]|uniref:TetR/AcrR family transcriptional regulator n=1 Tax=Janthinobacterium lividum TaxID=29581 RepID=UPI000893C1B6|nr:TetR/AcrR family transcriptional regulator [Janthinobacterium lividum]MCC7712879.1 TetR/AcrR family transcriptional regulator [Janthinobacterium lividum]OEZ55788.1 DNA-binding transcriptional repressor AcrR [Janthinobacterium lividum]WQE31316.1 helix-turn-helix domain-containing protein [Janthinobacterium lividum]STQ96844.1 Intercellular adhesion protein R [Janthinobacterium lividum]
MMKKRSASADNICAVAVVHFSEHGYDASSLSDIAGQAGMRKASLYSHFAGKDALFLDVFADALAEEQAFMDACFADEAALAATAGSALAGSLYCDRMAQRYADSAHLRFLLRTAYLPPAPLRIEVGTGYEALLAQLQQHYVASLGRMAPALPPQRVDLYAQAYLGIVDSLHVELIYAGGAALQQRHAALWQILSDSLAMATRHG